MACVFFFLLAMDLSVFCCGKSQAHGAITCRWKMFVSPTEPSPDSLSEAAMQAAALAVAEETVPLAKKNGFGKLLRDFWLLETQPKMDEIGL